MSYIIGDDLKLVKCSLPCPDPDCGEFLVPAKDSISCTVLSQCDNDAELCCKNCGWATCGQH